MIKKSIMIVLLAMGLLMTAHIGFAQDTQALQEDVKEAGTVTWKEVRKPKVESHAIKYSGATMTITKTCRHPGSEKIEIVAEIPLNEIDVTRFESHKHMEVNDLYYLGFYTKNDAKTIKVTRYVGGKVNGEPMYHHFHTIYSKTEATHKKMQERFKLLVESFSK